MTIDELTRIAQAETVYANANGVETLRVLITKEDRDTLVTIARAAIDQWEKDEILIVTGEGFRETRLAHTALGKALGKEGA
jgi:hypothetical protein